MKSTRVIVLGQVEEIQLPYINFILNHTGIGQKLEYCQDRLQDIPAEFYPFILQKEHGNYLNFYDLEKNLLFYVEEYNIRVD
jgi:hypothetical protein